jgi:hypothetical protein
MGIQRYNGRRKTGQVWETGCSQVGCSIHKCSQAAYCCKISLSAEGTT